MNLSRRLDTIRVSLSVAGIAVLCLAIVLGFSTPSAWAQTSASGAVSGQVTDPQGAAIAGAEVKILDASTSTTQTTTSNDVGRYNFATVAPGTYDLTVTHPGFTQAKVAAQKVDVGQSLILNVTLELGTTSTIVEVKATAGAELQTLNATIGETIT